MNMPHGQNHRRRSIRLPTYDYTREGLYFVTICSHGRACLFGAVEEEAVRLNTLGRIAAACWMEIPSHFPSVVLDAFVIMPNHVHGLIGIADTAAADVAVGAQHAAPLHPSPPPSPPMSGHPGALPVEGVTKRVNVSPRSLGAIVRSYKSAVTRGVNRLRATPGALVWQRNYHERVVRDGREAERIRRYIHQNPLRWHLDPENPHRAAPPPCPS